MMLHIDHIVKQYQHNGRSVRALDGISFTVEPGEFVTITGPSGSGKTTLLLSLFGLIRLTSGFILFNRYQIDNLTDRQLAHVRKHSVGYILQSFALVPYLTALQNVMIPMALLGRPKTEQAKHAAEILEYVGLADRIEHLPRELSAGQQQRVAIARSIVHKPQIILADEPTGNLDPKLSQDILEFLKQINRDQNITVLMVTHSPAASGFGTKKLHLDQGRIVNL